MGKSCGFVRLTGCNLRCSYCDTQYAYEKGTYMSISQILERIRRLNTELTCITGGEPLLQENTPELVNRLISANYNVLIETNGTKDISELNKEATVIMDVKCPGSNMSKHNRYEILEELNSKDEVKFVITSRKDFDWAISKIKVYRLSEKHTVLIGPVFGVLETRKVADWILETDLNLRLQPQLQRVIWGEGGTYRWMKNPAVLFCSAEVLTQP